LDIKLPTARVLRLLGALQ